VSLITRKRAGITRKRAEPVSGRFRAGAARAGQRARLAASGAAPLAASARAAARQGLHSARAWAAPRVEQGGQALQHRVAPRVSELLSGAARRIEPAPRRRRRWPFLTAGLVAAAGALATAVLLLARRGTGPLGRKGGSGEGSAGDAASTPAPAVPDAASSADANGRVPAP
jgi:hypothetical protein